MSSPPTLLEAVPPWHCVPATRDRVTAPRAETRATSPRLDSNQDRPLPASKAGGSRRNELRTVFEWLASIEMVKTHLGVAGLLPACMP